MPRLNVKLTNESPRALSVCFVAAFAQRRGAFKVPGGWLTFLLSLNYLSAVEGLKQQRRAGDVMRLAPGQETTSNPALI